MFTGIIEGRGRVEALGADGPEIRLRVASPFAEAPARGESVAVDGVCLTVAAGGPGWFEAVLSPETLARTTLQRLAPGEGVNLERALRLGDRLGGHLVQGHVDGVGTVAWSRPEGSGARLCVRLPPELRPLVVMKGSIAVDGVSLTVAALSEDRFEVALIPETLSRTGLGEAGAGRAVNLEMDMMGRYVVEYLRGRERSDAPALVTREHLSRHGFGGRSDEREA